MVVLVGVVVRSVCVQCYCVVLTVAGGKVHCGPPTQQGVLVVGESALAPRPYFKAVLVLALPSRTVNRARTSPELCQVGTVCTSVHWCGQDMSSPMLQASAAGFAAK